MKQQIAVIGLFHREYFYIPFWQNYYGELFGFNNLYVVGNLEDDEAMRLFHSSVNQIHYKPELFANHTEHTHLIINLQNHLLNQGYNTVVFAEADQFFVPDPDKYLHLNDYLFNNKNDYIKVSGWNVRHLPDEEPIYNPSEKILGQRKYWYKDPGPEDKLVIIRKPISWYDVGFHRSHPDVERDPFLFNIHLNKFDFSMCNSRNYIRTSAKNWHPASGKHGHGFHVFKYDDDLLKDWIYENSKIKLQIIPDKFKNIL